MGRLDNIKTRLDDGFELGTPRCKAQESRRNDLEWAVREIERLREELAELIDDAFRRFASEQYGGDRHGWWDTCGLTLAMMYGDRLVELGLWEKHPTGHGRRWWYRPVKRKAVEKAGE